MYVSLSPDHRQSQDSRLTCGSSCRPTARQQQHHYQQQQTRRMKMKTNMKTKTKQMQQVTTCEVAMESAEQEGTVAVSGR